MKELILSKLREIEKEYNVKILLAVESGSRAWGFASPDSDYDVRFIYAREAKDYLKLEAMRDVIELPINDNLDVNGWDLQKTLRLLYNSNPALFEWFSSPVVYVETEFAEIFRSIMTRYFSGKKGICHYLSMAERHYHVYLKGESVNIKKYFYVLRPILACRWLLDTGTQPPMLFSELVKAELPDSLLADVERLLELKMNCPEIKKTRPVLSVHRYIEESLADIKGKLDLFPDIKNDWRELDELFLKTIGLNNAE